MSTKETTATPPPPPPPPLPQEVEEEEEDLLMLGEDSTSMEDDNSSSSDDGDDDDATPFGDAGSHQSSQDAEQAVGLPIDVASADASGGSITTSNTSSSSSPATAAAAAAAADTSSMRKRTPQQHSSSSSTYYEATPTTANRTIHTTTTTNTNANEGGGGGGGGVESIHNINNNSSFIVEDVMEHQHKLEERIEELELKLKTLSRLLLRQQHNHHNQQQQQQQLRPTPPPKKSKNNSSSSSSSTTRCVSPVPTRTNDEQKNDSLMNIQQQQQTLDDDDEELRRLSVLSPSSKNTASTPHLESPAPGITKHTRRNLSLTLLFDNDEEEYQKNINFSSTQPHTDSMTPAEQQWLRPKILQYYTSTAAAAAAAAEQQEKPPEHGNNTNNNDLQQPLLSPQTATTTTTSNSDKTAHSATTTSNTTTTEDAREASSSNGGATPPRSSKDDEIDDDDDDDDEHRRHDTNKVRSKWLDYLNSFQECSPTPDVDSQMEEFIRVPGHVENIMSFGFYICVDSFLYMFTVLPIRFVWSILLLLIKLCCWVTSTSTSSSSSRSSRHHQAPPPPSRPSNPHFQFHRRHMYQLIQVLIITTVYRYVLLPISIGKLYHWIRGQAMIKLYVIIAMVEIFDRLFSSLGQDCLESMYWNTVHRPRSSRMIISILVVLVYAAIHTVILFVHVATLNVAMNSADQALLTLLISGNFAEIKSTVFKKYNKAALFKITVSDICERFKLGLFLSLVLLLNICQGMDHYQFLAYMRICGIVWCAEVTADWIKHAFITKFNFLPARVYPEYALVLAGDVTGIGHEGVNLDRSHAVVKRIGFAQIPLLCVMFRFLKEATKYASASYTLPDDDGSLHWRWLLLMPFATPSPQRRIMACVCLWVLLLLIKLALGSLLQRLSLGKLYAAPEFSQLSPVKKKKTQ